MTSKCGALTKETLFKHFDKHHPLEGGKPISRAAPEIDKPSADSEKCLLSPSPLLNCAAVNTAGRDLKKECLWKCSSVPPVSFSLLSSCDVLSVKGDISGRKYILQNFQQSSESHECNVASEERINPPDHEL